MTRIVKAHDVRKNEMILLRKSMYIESHKQGDPEKDFAGMEA